jgi:hypothetical protein
MATGHKLQSGTATDCVNIAHATITIRDASHLSQSVANAYESANTRSHDVMQWITLSHPHYQRFQTNQTDWSTERQIRKRSERANGLNELVQHRWCRTFS